MLAPYQLLSLALSQSVGEMVEFVVIDWVICVTKMAMRVGVDLYERRVAASQDRLSMQRVWRCRWFTAMPDQPSTW